jgi:transcriptional regulator GlxA family with amidase domain
MLSRLGNPANVEPPHGMMAARAGDFSDAGDARIPVRGGLPPRAFRRLHEFILAHLDENLSNSVLAEFAGLSAFYFARAFKQSAGVSPHQYVVRCRVEHVKHLLVQTELPLAEIAAIAGFGDQSHCSRWFRELVGVTPSRFRWLSR